MKQDAHRLRNANAVYVLKKAEDHKWGTTTTLKRSSPFGARKDFKKPTCRLDTQRIHHAAYWPHSTCLCELKIQNLNGCEQGTRTLGHLDLRDGSSLKSPLPLQLPVDVNLDESDRCTDFVAKTIFTSHSIRHVGIVIQPLDILRCITANRRDVSVIR